MFGFPLLWEKAYTIDYRVQVTPWLVIQPTAQYFASIGGDPRRGSGMVFGFRTYLRL
jgi:carbohydrate-selective porin OprB